MKVTHLCALAVVGLLTTSHSCRKDEQGPCPNQEITGTVPQLYPCLLDRSGNEARVFVINSVAEYSAAFPCASTLPSQVDFTANTLLVGWKNYCCCGHVKSQRLLLACPPATYTYQVEIEAGVCTAAIPVASALLVPKLPAGAKVQLEMQ